MTIIEQIKAEIERLKATNPREYNYQNAEGYVWALDDILSFLSTLGLETKKDETVPIRIYLGSKYEFIRRDIILKEIEVLKKNNEVSDDSENAQYEFDVACGYNMACDDILSFLSTLESEKPSKELEEEIERWWGEQYMKNSEGLPILPVVQGIARHFAQWSAGRQKEQDDELVDIIYQQGIEKGKDDMKEQILKEAEKPCHTVEEWMEHIKNADALTKAIFSKGPYDVLYDALNRPYRDCYDAIKEFGELCYQTARQDMMKEAVEGEIFDDYDKDTCEHHLTILSTVPSCYKDGDKVRIIIVKE